MGMNGRQEEEPEHHNPAIFPRSTYSMLYQVDLYNAMFNCKQSYRGLLCSALLYYLPVLLRAFRMKMDTDCQIDLDLHLRPIIPRMCRLDLFITRYSMKLLRRMLPDAHMHAALQPSPRAIAAAK